MRDNEKIIQIASELQQQIREGVIALIQAGTPMNGFYPLFEAMDRLERIPMELSECLDHVDAPVAIHSELHAWTERALKAEAELQRRIVLAQMGHTPESLAIAERSGC